MQSKVHFVTTSRITPKVQAEVKTAKPGPVEVTTADLKQVAGGGSPNGTWRYKATVSSPNGTW